MEPDELGLIDEFTFSLIYLRLSGPICG